MISLAETQNSWRCVFVLLAIIVTGAYIIANGLAGLNPLTPEIKRTFEEIFQKRYDEPMADKTWTLLLSLTMSMTYAGGLVGSLLVNPVLKWLSRKKALSIIHVTHIVGLVIVAAGMKWAMSYEMVICGRFLIGVSVGMGMTTFPLFINEVSVSQKRQFYGAIYGGLLPLAATVVTFFSWSKIMGSYDLLLGAILFGAIFSVIFFACIHWIPETPYQVYLHHGPEVTLKNLRRLRVGDDHMLRRELESLTSCKEKTLNSAQVVQGEASLQEIWTTAHYRKHFISVVVIFSLQMACGASNVFSFADKIFVEAGLPEDVVTPATMGIYFVAALASVAAIAAMQKLDPRSIMIFFCVVIALSHVLMTVSMQTSEYIPEMSWTSLAAMYFFMMPLGGLNTVTFAVMGILCVDRTRALCLNVAGAGFWFFAWFVGFIYPYLSVWIQGYAFLIWMAITVLGIVYMVFFLPRTRGKTEDEIQDFYKK